MSAHFPFPASKKQSLLFQALKLEKSNAAHRNPDKKHKPTLLIKINKIEVSIPVQHILFVKSEHVYCRIFFTNHQQTLQRISLEDLLSQLPQDHFLHVHRSYVVNVEHILKFNSKKIFIGDTVITIGRTRRHLVVPRLKSLLG